LGSVSTDISNTLYQSPYLLYGLTELAFTGTQAIAFTSSIDQDYVFTATSSRAVGLFTIVYIAVGVAPGNLCSTCGKGLIASGKDCVSSCPQNTYAFTYGKTGVACRSCSAKLGLVLSSGKCIVGTAPVAPDNKPTVPAVVTTTVITTTTSSTVPTVISKTP
jgi:hypothetical protein